MTAAGFVLVGLLGCGQHEPCPYYHLRCGETGSGAVGPNIQPDSRIPKQIGSSEESPEGVSLTATTGALRAFLGADSFKLVLGTGKRLYLLLPGSDAEAPLRWVRIDRGDEGPNGGTGWPNEPLFSPDGKWVAFAGDFAAQSKVASFVRQASAGMGWRVPLVRENDRAAQPHWYREDGDLRLYVTDLPGTASWNASANSLTGGTFMADFLDSAVSRFVPATVGEAPLPGAFKGGISKDGKWVGTSYQTSVLFETSSRKAAILNQGIQQCNPSMNPFASGSNTDYMMILGFGGAVPVPTLDGPVNEGQHENLWIWSKDDKAVWAAALPNIAPHSSIEVPGIVYTEWQRPEWSTHPDFATAFAKRQGTPDGEGYDLIVVKTSDVAGALQTHDRTTMMRRGPVLRIDRKSVV